MQARKGRSESGPEVGCNAAAVIGAIVGLAFSELAAQRVPVDRWSLGLIGLGLLVALQIAWSYTARGRERVSPLLVFCEAAVAFCLARLLADAVDIIR